MEKNTKTIVWVLGIAVVSVIAYLIYWRMKMKKAADSTATASTVAVTTVTPSTPVVTTTTA